MGEKVKTVSYLTVPRTLTQTIRLVPHGPDPPYGWNSLDTRVYTIPTPSMELSGVCRTEGINGYEGPKDTNSNHSCYHWVYNFESCPISHEGPEYLVYDYGPGNFSRYETQSLSGVHCHPTGGVPTLFNPISDADRSGWFNKGVSDTLEQIPVQINLPNFLLEFREIPKLIVSAQKLAALGYHDFKSLKLALRTKGGRRQMTQKVSGTWANSHLAYQFGVLPLVRDVQTLINLAERTKSRIAYLKQNRGKPTKIKRLKRFFLTPITDPRYVAYANNYNISDVVQTKWTPRLGITTLSMGLTFVHDLQGLDDFRSQIVALTAAAGFNRPVSVLWEATPLSFLLDYFVNLGDIFAGYPAYMPFQGDITCLAGWSWTKTEEVSLIEYKWEQPGAVFEGVGGNAYRKTFSREVGIPTSQGLSFQNRLTLGQSTNIIALVRQAL